MKHVIKKNLKAILYQNYNRRQLHRIKYLLALMLCVIGISLTAAAAPWDLDSAFGTGGKVVWSPDGNTQSAGGSAMALQPDGKIVMVGGSNENAGTGVFMVVRFNSDGSIDSTFDGDGRTTITFGGANESAASVAVQPDGKIVVGGNSSQSGSGSDSVIARLNSDGSLDTTFDGDGKAIVKFTDFQGHQNDFLRVLKIASDGKIVFAGGAGPGTAILYKTTIGRLNPDGSLDTTFDTDGMRIDGLGSGIFSDLIPNADGTIYLSGTASAQFQSTIFVYKFNNNGGVAWSYFRGVQPGCYMSFNGIAAQADGKLIAVGSNLCRPFAVRINPDGSGDNTFDETPLTFSGAASAVAIQADGKILATVGLDVHNIDGFSLVRYNTNGTLDSTWGEGGIARVRVLNGSERTGDLVIQPDGKILVGGSVSVTFTSGYRFGLARYLGATSPNPTLFDYDDDGKADVSVFRPSENKWYVLRSSDQVVAQQVFAVSGDVPVPSDWDGDGKTDFAVYRPSSGDWWYLSSVNNAQVYAQWGFAGAIPRPSDFDGDNKTDYVFYYPGNNYWYRFGTSAGASFIQFGAAGDKPVIGDFDGDGKTDIAVYRPSTGDWWWQSSVDNIQRATHWGLTNDIPVPADYDGDGKTDFAVYRESNGEWWILNSSNGSHTAVGFGGNVGDKPVAADYDGDGKADIAIFRANEGNWYLRRTTSGFTVTQFGAVNDIPTPGAFLP